MKITSPVKGYTDTTTIGPVTLTFQDGVADYNDTLPAGVRAYLKEQGYGLGSTSAKAPEPAPEPLDPRKAAADQQVGTKIRDGAVDPRPGDFLGPTNAGEANPHGTAVVNPEIHASEGVRPVKPGEVHVGDPAAQDKAETAHAAAATDGTPVTASAGIEVPEGDLDSRIEWVAGAEDQETARLRADAIFQHEKDAGDTDLEALGARLTAAVYGDRTQPEPEPVELKGEALDKALEDAGLPKSGSADEKRARLADHLAKKA